MNELLKKLLAKLGIELTGDPTDEQLQKALTELDSLQASAKKAPELEAALSAEKASLAALKAQPGGQVDLAQFVPVATYNALVTQVAALMADLRPRAPGHLQLKRIVANQVTPQRVQPRMVGGTRRPRTIGLPATWAFETRRVGQDFLRKGRALVCRLAQHREDRKRRREVAARDAVSQCTASLRQRSQVGRAQVQLLPIQRFDVGIEYPRGNRIVEPDRSIAVSGIRQHATHQPGGGRLVVGGNQRPGRSLPDLLRQGRERPQKSGQGCQQQPHADAAL